MHQQQLHVHVIGCRASGGGGVGALYITMVISLLFETLQLQYQHRSPFVPFLQRR